MWGGREITKVEVTLSTTLYSSYTWNNGTNWSNYNTKTISIGLTINVGGTPSVSFTPTATQYTSKAQVLTNNTYHVRAGFKINSVSVTITYSDGSTQTLSA